MVFTVVFFIGNSAVYNGPKHNAEVLWGAFKLEKL